MADDDPEQFGGSDYEPYYPDVDDGNDYRKCCECETQQHESMGATCKACDEWVCNGCEADHNQSITHLENVASIREQSMGPEPRDE